MGRIDKLFSHLFELFTKKLLPLHPQRIPAPVVKLVDTPDLGSGNSGCVGSSPIRRTENQNPLNSSGFYALI